MKILVSIFNKAVNETTIGFPRHNFPAPARFNVWKSAAICLANILKGFKLNPNPSLQIHKNPQQSTVYSKWKSLSIIVFACRFKHKSLELQPERVFFTAGHWSASKKGNLIWLFRPALNFTNDIRLIWSSCLFCFSSFAWKIQRWRYIALKVFDKSPKWNRHIY